MKLSGIGPVAAGCRAPACDRRQRRHHRAQEYQKDEHDPHAEQDDDRD